MFDPISNEDLRELAAVESKNCISFYLPTHVKGPGTAADSLRLKNLVAKAKTGLEKRALRSSDVAELLQPVDAIVNDARFWTHAGEGLALFVNSDSVKTFRLPGPVGEAMLISDRFWIAPIVPFVTADDGFHLLVLSEKSVRLMRGDLYALTELELGEIPASQAEALRFDDRESQLHSHGATRVGSGAVSATFHGQGVATDFDDIDRGRFLQAVDRGLAGVLKGDSSPLVLAGVGEIVSQFRNLSDNRNIVRSSIAGAAGRLSLQELHQKALPLVASKLDAGQTHARELYDSPPTLTVDTVTGAIDAATNGRVATLLIASGQSVWGTVDPERQQVEEHIDRQPGDGDLIDLVVRETLEHGGEVFAVDAANMPRSAPLAAVLRY